MVSGSSSDDEGGGGVKRPAPSFAYTAKFNEAFPFYLSIGMTPEQYWDGDAEWAVAFRKAALIKRDLRNQDAWIQGAYIYEAILNVAPVLQAFAKKGTKPTPYRKEPFDFSTSDGAEKSSRTEKKEEQADKNAKAYMEAFAIAINKKFKEGGAKNAEKPRNAGD